MQKVKPDSMTSKFNKLIWQWATFVHCLSVISTY